MRRSGRFSVLALTTIATLSLAGCGGGDQADGEDSAAVAGEGQGEGEASDTGSGSTTSADQAQLPPCDSAPAIRLTAADLETYIRGKNAEVPVVAAAREKLALSNPADVRAEALGKLTTDELATVGARGANVDRPRYCALTRQVERVLMLWYSELQGKDTTTLTAAGRDSLRRRLTADYVQAGESSATFILPRTGVLGPLYEKTTLAAMTAWSGG